MKSRRPRGFTLVEILTVMVVIGLLAGIMLPRFARARFSAELGACQSNLKALGQAVRMYANDNSQTLPPTLTAMTVATGGQRGYIPTVTTCPSNQVVYLYSPGADQNTFTVTCNGIHYKVLTGQVSIGYPQFQSNSLTTQ